MVHYDAAVLNQYAQKLYREAAFLAVLYAVLGFLIGGIPGAVLQSMSKTDTPVGWLLAIIAAAVGAGIGRIRGFMLRVEAQRVLCELERERHLARIVEGQKVFGELQRDRQLARLS